MRQRAWHILNLAQEGTLKSLYLEPLTPYSGEPHTALVDALAAYGPSRMVLIGPPYAYAARQSIQTFSPDLVIFGYIGTGITAGEMAGLRQTFSDAFVVNYEADAYPRTQAAFDLAAQVDLQIVASPSYFPQFAAHGLDAGWWPGWTQTQYLQAQRQVTGPDVVFIGALYDDSAFDNVAFRREAVVAMARSGLDFALYGPGWGRVGLRSQATTFGQYARNAQLYASAKIGLSVDNVRNVYCACSDRPYNIAATGCLCLTNTFPGMEAHGFVDGKTCAVFDDVGGMLEAARYYVAHDAERERIGQAGREMVHRRHTWPARIEALWAMLEGLIKQDVQ